MTGGGGDWQPHTLGTGEAARDDSSERARNKERGNSTALICSTPAKEGPSHVAS